jgi:hypothetical protein
MVHRTIHGEERLLPSNKGFTLGIKSKASLSGQLCLLKQNWTYSREDYRLKSWKNISSAVLRVYWWNHYACEITGKCNTYLSVKPVRETNVLELSDKDFKIIMMNLWRLLKSKNMCNYVQCMCTKYFI